MPFRPVVRSSLAFNNNQYLFTEHPSAKGMAYGQTGRRATVYQVVDGNGRYYALKVFTLAFRNPRTETNAQKLQAFADLPGLQVCTRLTITLQAHASLVQQYPDLQYAVLMPWIEGQTWQEVMLSGQSFSKQQTHILAQWLVCVLAVLEQRGLAHCDLSGPNILLPGLPTLSNVSQNTPDNPLALVDIEELYSSGLEKPDKLPAGSAGYGHKVATQGIWYAEGDRFAGAVLLVEMLGWHDEKIRRIAYGEQYFDPDEIHENSERYQILSRSLEDHWGKPVAEAWAQAWFSDTLGNCPNLAEWYSLLIGQSLPSAVQTAATVQSSTAGSVISSHQRPAADLDQLRSQVYRQAGYGRWDEVIQLCTQILDSYPGENELLQLSNRAQRLVALENDIQQAWIKASQSGQYTDWEIYLKLVSTAQYQAPNVGRYREQREHAEQEMNAALSVDQAKQLIAEKRWDEALALLQDVPSEHPRGSELRAQIDLEQQRIERVAECTRQAQKALAEGNWKEAARAARQGLTLGGDTQMLKSALDQAYRGLEISQQAQALLELAQKQFAESAWGNALNTVSKALVLEPRQAMLIRLQEDILIRKEWTVQVEKAQRARQQRNWDDILPILANVPEDFMDAGTLRKQAQEYIQWQANLQFAQQSYDLQGVIACLDQRPAGEPDKDVLREWVKKELHRRQQIEAARCAYDGETVITLLKQTPVSYHGYNDLLQWAQTELDRNRELEQARQEYNYEKVSGILVGMPNDHPTKAVWATWVKEERESRNRMQAAQQAYDVDNLLRLLETFASDHPLRAGLCDWANRELANRAEINATRQSYNLVALERLLNALPADHPWRQPQRAWLNSEQARLTAVTSARAAYRPYDVLQHLEDAPEQYPDLDKLISWAQQELECQSRLSDAVQKYDLQQARQLLATLPEDHPQKEKFQNWVRSEQNRQDRLKAARRAFDSDQVIRLIAQTLASYPDREKTLAWAVAEQERSHNLQAARNAFDAETVLVLIKDTPAEYPSRASLIVWANNERNRRQRLVDARNTYRLGEVQNILAEWPSTHPVQVEVRGWLKAEEARAEQLIVARQSGKADDVLRLMADVSPEYPDYEEIHQWVKQETASQVQLQSAIQSYDLEAVHQWLAQTPERHHQKNAVQKWMQIEQNRRQILETARREFDCAQVLRLLESVDDHYPGYAEMKAWANAEAQQAAHLEIAIQSRDIVQCQQVINPMSPNHPLRIKAQAWLIAENERQRRAKETVRDIQQAMDGKQWEKAVQICQEASRQGLIPADNDLFGWFTQTFALVQNHLQRQNEARAAALDAEHALQQGDFTKALMSARKAGDLDADNPTHALLINRVRNQIAEKAQVLENSRQWDKAVNVWSLLQTDGFGGTEIEKKIRWNQEMMASRRRLIAGWAVGCLIILAILVGVMSYILSSLLNPLPLQASLSASTATRLPNLPKTSPGESLTPIPSSRQNNLATAAPMVTNFPTASSMSTTTSTSTATSTPTVTHTKSPTASRTRTPTQTASLTVTFTATLKPTLKIPTRTQPPPTEAPRPTNPPPTEAPRPTDPPPTDSGIRPPTPTP